MHFSGRKQITKLIDISFFLKDKLFRLPGNDQGEGLIDIDCHTACIVAGRN